MEISPNTAQNAGGYSLRCVVCQPPLPFLPIEAFGRLAHLASSSILSASTLTSASVHQLSRLLAQGFAQ